MKKTDLLREALIALYGGLVAICWGTMYIVAEARFYPEAGLLGVCLLASCLQGSIILVGHKEKEETKRRKWPPET